MFQKVTFINLQSIKTSVRYSRFILKLTTYQQTNTFNTVLVKTVKLNIFNLLEVN